MIGDAYYGGQTLDTHNKVDLVLSYSGLSEANIKRGYTSYLGDRGGYGGKGGKGGKISVSQNINLLCYNGNAITDGVSTTITIATNDGGFRGKVLSAVSLPNGETIVPAFIYAQAGILRANRIYTSYVPTIYKSFVSHEVTYADQNTAGVDVEIITIEPEKNTDKLGYIGPIGNQGIGSGAGRIESSNGEFDYLD